MTIMNRPLCKTCRWWTYRQALVNRQPKEWPACEKEIRGFPEMKRCRDWMREVGSDDE